MAKRGIAGNLGAVATLPVRPSLSATPNDWRTLVEQIAELEDILFEAGAALDQDAIPGRVWLQRVLIDKRRRLRDIDVGV